MHPVYVATDTATALDSKQRTRVSDGVQRAAMKYGRLVT